VSVLGFSRPAAACGACTCDDQPRSIVNLVRGVPLNLQIPLRVLEEGEAAPWLERADGAMVSATVERRAAPSVWWLTVDRDLEPNTDYFITREAGVEAGFTTGSARDEAPPTLESISAKGGGNEALCSASVGGLITLSGASDDGESFNVWLELELISGGTPYLIFTDYLYAAQPLALGTSEMGCFGSLEVPGMVAGAGYALGAWLHDAAGNVSELRTSAFNAQASGPPGCGMPSDSAGSSPVEPSPSAGSGGAAPASAGKPTLTDTDAERTSKGCGCSVPGRPREPAAEGWLAALLLLGLAACRRRN
jgi:MYXO-CTERM domain-containing protein